MEQTIITIVVAIIGSGAFSTVVSQMCNAWNKRQEQKSGVAEGLRLVLKDRLKFLCIRYIEQGWIYADELEDLMRMHQCYHTGLGGNGYLDELMADIKKLPIKGVHHHE